MGLLDRLLGREEGGVRDRQPAPPHDRQRPPTDDERAVERYQYLLRTAPPDQVEQAHAEAFAQLTPEQRRMALEQLTAASAPGEAPADDRPSTLARAATRTEMRRPGALREAFGGAGATAAGGMAGALPGVGAVLLTSLAGAFVGTAIAQSLLGPLEAGDGGSSEGDPAEGEGDAGGDAADAGAGESGGLFDGFFDGGSGDGGLDAGGFDGGF